MRDLSTAPSPTKKLPDAHFKKVSFFSLGHRHHIFQNKKKKSQLSHARAPHKFDRVIPLSEKGRQRMYELHQTYCYYIRPLRAFLSYLNLVQQVVLEEEVTSFWVGGASDVPSLTMEEGGVTFGCGLSWSWVQMFYPNERLRSFLDIKCKKVLNIDVLS